MKTDTAISTRRAPSSETRDLSAVDSSWLDNQHAASLESAKRESNIGTMRSMIIPRCNKLVKQVGLMCECLIYMCVQGIGTSLRRTNGYTM